MYNPNASLFVNGKREHLVKVVIVLKLFVPRCDVPKKKELGPLVVTTVSFEYSLHLTTIPNTTVLHSYYIILNIIK